MAGKRNDPLGVFNFFVTLIDSSDVVGTLLSAAVNYQMAGFSECSGLDASIEVVEYKEGGQNTFVHKFASRASFSNLTLRNGILFLTDDLWVWHHDFVLGRGKRRDGTITLLDEARKPAKVWKFRRGIPMKWVGPSLNANQSAIAIESLEIAHEGLSLEVGA